MGWKTKLGGQLFALTWNVVVGAFEAVLIVGSALYKLTLVGVDAVAARRLLTDGVLHCPRGHAIPTTGETYQCRACGFVYGEPHTVWLCPNPECPAPVTPYVDCCVCGLSVRSPFRWGRP